MTTPVITTEKEGSANDHTIKAEIDDRGSLSPFRKTITSGQTDNKPSNTFGLDSYIWYPEDFEDVIFGTDHSIDSLKQTYEDNGIGVFGNISIANMNKDSFSLANIKKTAGSIINKSAGYASKQFEGVKDSIINFFDKTEEDKEKTNVYKNDMLHHIPRAIINEFRPNNTITEGVSKLKKIFSMAENLFESDNLGSTLKQMFSEENMQTLITDIISDGDPNVASSLNFKSGEDMETKVMTIPNYIYRNLIGGYFTARYEVPFAENETYMKAAGAEGWESRSLKDRLLGPLASIADKFSDVASAFDIASKPKWSLNGAGPTFDGIECEFHLFNYNSSAFEKNFAFIHTLMPGNMWYQRGLLQHSSSLYDIEVPGRYRFYLCKADFKVDFIGKVRKPSQTIVDNINKLAADGYVVNPNAIATIPDAYKVTMSFTPLVPNNFNLYLNYMLDKYNSKFTTGVGTTRKDFSGDLLSKISKNTEENIETSQKNAEGSQ